MFIEILKSIISYGYIINEEIEKAKINTLIDGGYWSERTKIIKKYFNKKNPKYKMFLIHFFDDDIDTFIEYITTRGTLNNKEKASLELAKVAFDYFDNELMGVCFDSTLFASITLEFLNLINTNSINDFDSFEIGTSWEDIAKKGNKILEKYNIKINNGNKG